MSAVRGHRRACPGISGLADHVERIKASVLPASGSFQPTSSQLSGSQQAARPAGSAAPSQPRWAPVPFAPSIPASQPAQEVSSSLEVAALRQEIVTLRQAVTALAEVNTNDIRHLSEARVIEAEKSNPWPWIIGIGLVGVVAYWMLAPSEDRAIGVSMGNASGPAAAFPKIADKVVSKVVDRALNKALGIVF